MSMSHFTWRHMPPEKERSKYRGNRLSQLMYNGFFFILNKLNMNGSINFL